jgi:Fe2+ or Zn2+ uptake regulation protein
MAEKAPTKKAFDSASCPFCEGGALTPSPSGKHLVCRKCGRVVLSKSPEAQGAGKQP